MIFSKEMMKIRDELTTMWHEVILPHNTEKYANQEWSLETRAESTKNKIHWDLIKRYFNILKNVDAFLAVNFDKHNIPNYIGGNTFLEISFAHILDKKVYLLNPIPEMIYTDELTAMQPTILHGDLHKIIEHISR